MSVHPEPARPSLGDAPVVVRAWLSLRLDRKARALAVLQRAAQVRQGVAFQRGRAPVLDLLERPRPTRHRA